MSGKALLWLQLTKCLLANQAGGTVRLFHRENECYIAAEGSFAEDPAVVEDGRSFIHCTHGPTVRGVIILALFV